MFPLKPQAPVNADVFVDVCGVQELSPGGHITTVLGFTRVLVLRTPDDQLHAMVDLCPHALQPLAGGAVSEGGITCAKHGACFNLADGQPRNRVTTKPLTLYRVRARDGRVEVAGPAL